MYGFRTTFRMATSSLEAIAVAIVSCFHGRREALKHLGNTFVQVLLVPSPPCRQCVLSASAQIQLLGDGVVQVNNEGSFFVVCSVVVASPIPPNPRQRLRRRSRHRNVCQSSFRTRRLDRYDGDIAAVVHLCQSFGSQLRITAFLMRAPTTSSRAWFPATNRSCIWRNGLMIKVGFGRAGPMQIPTWSERQSYACCSIWRIFLVNCLRFSRCKWTSKHC